MRYFLSIFVLCIICSVAVPSNGRATIQDDILDALADKEWERAYHLSTLGGDSFTRDLAKWYYLLYDPVIPPHQDYLRFIKTRPDWPHQQRLKKRMEIAFLNETPSQDAIKRWFTHYKPITPRGILLLLDAHGRLTKTHLQELWHKGDFSVEEEAYIIRSHGHHIQQQTYEDRIDRLIWDRQYDAAKRMLPFISQDVARLSEARIAIANREQGLAARIDQVPDKFSRHPSLLFERIRFRARQGDYAGVEELLLQAPATLPYAKKWWPYQNRVIRDAIEDKRYSISKKLLDKHGQHDAAPFVEAEWMRGWFYLSFMNQPQISVKAFENLYETATMPISRSRGSYWAARSYEVLGDKKRANIWYKRSSSFPTTFYGQLAHQKLSPNTPLPLSFSPHLNDSQANDFAQRNELASQLITMASYKHADLIWPHINHYLEQRGAPNIYANFAATARVHHALPLAIKIAKKAHIKGLYLPELYPTPPVPYDLPTDPSLTLAIARQESRFDHLARSSADARGLMQVLPSTARRVAKAHKLPYSIKRLYQPRLNMLLGSHYIDGLLTDFSGSYILSIAGYNAGPKRSDLWVSRFGALSHNEWRENIEWIEKIPFAETRNYVQRVLENYHVYQHIANSETSSLKAREALLMPR